MKHELKHGIVTLLLEDPQDVVKTVHLTTRGQGYAAYEVTLLSPLYNCTLNPGRLPVTRMDLIEWDIDGNGHPLLQVEVEELGEFYHVECWEQEELDSEGKKRLRGFLVEAILHREHPAELLLDNAQEEA